MIKPIETKYKGYKFRSRLEARWAVFFDALNVDWEYEPEGFDLGDGIKYLPDFVIHNIYIRDGSELLSDLYVEVKGRMTDADKEKIKRFAEFAPILVVGNIPTGDTLEDIYNYFLDFCYRDGLFSYEFIDGDHYPVLPFANKLGRMVLYTENLSPPNDYYCWRISEMITVNAYARARQARFEHGENVENYKCE